MAKKLWYEIKFFNDITQKWELVAKVKSKGLAFQTADLYSKIYKQVKYQ